MLAEFESRMGILNAQPPGTVDREVERGLQAEHDQILLKHEAYWHQRARVKWALFGDANTQYFHAMATTRRRRNSIKAIQIGEGVWETEERKIRKLFLGHFRNIYTAC